ncbi:tetratricopeptide repeat protein [Paraflavitalea pollutisoli]|uniref:tetratricopeptide repeat protein n=1 Tax=Paraflavitalea pollutisoli TaxID=3034143 RepID=UPI0023EC22ED|nr:tetratricopeptide repeat protein [Paraflavitalea sp. H1-2-19X]
MLRKRSFITALILTCHSFTPLLAQNNATAQTALNQLMEGNFFLAQQTANTVIAADANQALAYAVRASGAMFENKMPSAQADLEKALKLQPTNGTLVALQADYYRISGNSTAARTTAEKAIGMLRNAQSSFDYYARGLAYSALDKSKESLADYSKCIELNPRNARALTKRGFIYFSQQQYEPAMADYNKAIAVNPRYGTPYHYRGNIYLNQNLPDKAIPDYTQSINLDPTFADSWFNRGVCYKRIGKPEEAIADYTKAIQLNPKDWEAYNNRGNVYYDQKKYDAALSEYNKSVEVNPKAPNTYVLRGNTYNARQQPEQALREYNKALDLDPNFKDAYMQHGFVLYRNKQLDEALKDFNKVLQIDPKSANGYLYLAFIHHDKQHFQEALNNYNKAIELDAKNMYAYQNRAEAYDAIGKSKEADLDRKKFAELGGNITATGGNTMRSLFPLGTFDPAIAKAGLERGLSTIRGKACTKVDGRIFDAQGVKVVLFPVTPYLEEWYDLREKKEGKHTNVYMSNEANQYRIETTADADGRFEFKGLKPGKYFIQIIHSFNQLKTAKVYTGSDTYQNGPVRTTTNYYYNQDYTVARAKRLEKFVEVKTDGDTQKITLANGLIKSCAF